jgi:DNA invertase Pin-like site-specific DNA recombinase
MVKQNKIAGILSYSPDRQARNMMEGGELINCVDEGLVDLKYTNFHFENTASGKMMLGIWFVFSKQYSDKLSEDVSR